MDPRPGVVIPVAVLEIEGPFGIAEIVTYGVERHEHSHGARINLVFEWVPSSYARVNIQSVAWCIISEIDDVLGRRSNRNERTV